MAFLCSTIEAMKNLLIDFQKLGSNPVAALKNAVAQFVRIGLAVSQSEASPALKKTSGIAYREAYFTMADSQKVTFRIKESGDIFQVLINDKLVPIKSQDDHKAAIEEIGKRLDASRAKFQAVMAKAKTPLPPSIKTAVPKMVDALKAKLAGINEAIATYEQDLGIAPQPA